MIRKIIFTATVFLFALGCNCGDSQQKNKEAGIDFILEHLHNPKSDYVLVASHRGDWRNFPENSLEAIDAAIKMGVDIVEIDIAMTKDSVLILMHDRTLDRASTGKGLISDVSYDSVKLCKLRLGYGHPSRYEIPTLEQALELCKDRVVINIDKGYVYYDQVMLLLDKTGTADQILIKGSAKPASVASKMADYENNMLYMPIIDYRKSSASKLFKLYLAQNEAPSAYEIVWSELTPEVEQAMRDVVASGAKLWTNSLWDELCGGLDDDRALENVEAIYGEHLRFGATMIQTDRPQLLIDYLRSKGRHK